MVSGGLFPVFQFSLGHGGSKGNVPERWSIRPVCLTTIEIVQEGLLGNALGMVINGAIGQRPIHAETEGSPQVFELLLVLEREFLAQLNKVPPADGLLITWLRAICCSATLQGWDEPFGVGERRVAAHTVVVLDPPLGG